MAVCAGHLSGPNRRRLERAFAYKGFSKPPDVCYVDARTVVLQAKNERKSAKQHVNERVDEQGN